MSIIWTIFNGFIKGVIATHHTRDNEPIIACLRV